MKLRKYYLTMNKYIPVKLKYIAVTAVILTTSLNCKHCSGTVEVIES